MKNTKDENGERHGSWTEYYSDRIYWVSSWIHGKGTGLNITYRCFDDRVGSCWYTKNGDAFGSEIEFKYNK